MHKKTKIKNRRRIIEMTYEAGVSHLGSALSCVDIIESVYQVKDKKEKFILSSGHSATALYAVLENHGYIVNPKILDLEVHPKRNPEVDIHVSTGSLGQGLPIAVGMALANKKLNVFCCISDGECSEGSISEALRIGADNKINNLIVIVNANGFAAYRKTKVKKLIIEFKAFGWNVIEVPGHNINKIINAIKPPKEKPTLVVAITKVNEMPFLNGLHAHYYKMTQEDYDLAMKILKYD